jgi:hypothetical protein
MRMGGALVRVSDPFLTPARTGLILLALLLLGAIVVRVITVSAHSDVRTPAGPENGGPVTSGAAVRGLRGSVE